MKKKSLSLALLTVIAVATFSASARACPMCKDSIGGEASGPNTGLGGDGMSGPSAGLPSGFNNSVYVMLMAFGGTLGLVGYTLVRGERSGANPLPQKSRDGDGTK